MAAHPTATLTSAERKALEATKFPNEHLTTALRKFDSRVRNAHNDRFQAVTDNRYWEQPRTDGPPSSRGISGRERIFCASVLYFEFLEAGQTTESSDEMKQVVALIGSLIREHTRYEFPIAKQPDVAQALTLAVDL